MINLENLIILALTPKVRKELASKVLKKVICVDKGKVVIVNFVTERVSDVV